MALESDAQRVNKAAMTAIETALRVLQGNDPALVEPSATLPNHASASARASIPTRSIGELLVTINISDPSDPNDLQRLELTGNTRLDPASRQDRTSVVVQGVVNGNSVVLEAAQYTTNNTRRIATLNGATQTLQVGRSDPYPHIRADDMVTMITAVASALRRGVQQVTVPDNPLSAS